MAQKSLEFFLNVDVYAKTREGHVMTSEIITLPHNPEAEQSVIGGILLDDDNSERVQKVLAMLKPESFYGRAHQIIFAEIRQMFRENKPVDGLTLFDSLEHKGLAEQVGDSLTSDNLPRTLPALPTS